MIKLFGCSFTNWIYPTWADFVKIHYKNDVEIYGRPGLGNDVFKRLLLTEVVGQDHVIVMLSGNDRIDHAVEGKDNIDKLPYYLKNESWTHSFPHKDQCFVQLNSSGVDFKKHFSLFHALYKQAEGIVDMQNHSKAYKFKLQFLSWQDLFSDLSFRRDTAGLGKQVDLDRYQQNPLFRKVFDMIDFDEFLDDLPKEFELRPLAEPRDSTIRYDIPHTDEETARLLRAFGLSPSSSPRIAFVPWPDPLPQG